jgi:hypothetical protein
MSSGLQVSAFARNKSFFLNPLRRNFICRPGVAHSRGLGEKNDADSFETVHLQFDATCNHPKFGELAVFRDRSAIAADWESACYRCLAYTTLAVAHKQQGCKAPLTFWTTSL